MKKRNAVLFFVKTTFSRPHIQCFFENPYGAHNQAVKSKFTVSIIRASDNNNEHWTLKYSCKFYSIDDAWDRMLHAFDHIWRRSLYQDKNFYDLSFMRRGYEEISLLGYDAAFACYIPHVFSCLASSTVKVEATCSSEMSISITLHGLICQNIELFKTTIWKFFLSMIWNQIWGDYRILVVIFLICHITRV